MNSSGILPINCNVIVAPDAVADKKGSLYLPETVVEKDQHAQMTGTVVAVSDDAFRDEFGKTAWPIDAGSRIVFARYAGKKITGKDGVEYWLLKDRDVTGYEV